jgi:hypothetical protein
MTIEILSRHFKELKQKAGYLNSFVGTKFKDGKDTGQPAIVVFVSRKLPMAELAPEHILPTEIEGVPVDVIELAPKTWTAGRTSASELSPIEQRNLLGANKNSNPKVMVAAPKTYTGLEVDWLNYFSPIQNQKSCGSCISFGNTGVWEAIYRILLANPSLAYKLSEACGFFCAGGTCGTGLDCPTYLNYCQANPICLEQFLPYKDVDQSCHQGILQGWAQYSQKIKSWQATTDFDIIRQWIKQGPLVAVMAVYQSFFNYTGGVYQKQGPSDPLAGYHYIGRVGMSDSKQASHLRNSWDVTWGEEGYAWIAYGDSNFDDEAWQITPDITSPLPPPVPPPPPAPPALAITTSALPNATQNSPYSFLLQASGGVPPYFWAVNGTLPAGLTLSDKGVLSGTPIDLETAPIGFIVSDSGGSNDKATLILNIQPVPKPKPGCLLSPIAKIFKK